MAKDDIHLSRPVTANPLSTVSSSVPAPPAAAHSATKGGAAGDRPQRTSNSGSSNKKIVIGDSDVRLNMLSFCFSIALV